jgi:soluble lytic murein transglycosylase-like protein
MLVQEKRVEAEEKDEPKRSWPASALTSLAEIVAGLFFKALEWVMITLLLYLLLVHMGHYPAKAAEIAIPRAAEQYRADLIRVAHSGMGLDAPTALLAAQIHQESRWNPNAKSPVGAQGLAQFMPATARWLPSVAPHTGKPLPFNPGWALRALAAYDWWLYRRIEHTVYDCERWAFVLCAYNGGLGWVQRDRALAARRGLDPSRYWDSVEKVNAGRKASAFRENRGYPARIFALQTAYERQGWGPGVVCPERGSYAR